MTDAAKYAGGFTLLPFEYDTRKYLCEFFEGMEFNGYGELALIPGDERSRW
jgi:hypothetical protein